LGKELAKNHRFGSSGVNLAFEGLLLGANLCLQVSATSSNPHESDSESTTPMYNEKEAPLCFARRQRYQRSPDEGLRRWGKERAFGGMKAKDVSRRQRARCHSKATASPPACVSVLLEAL
jgi:hypothetical protein